jgi:hypothetical protein
MDFIISQKKKSPHGMKNETVDSSVPGSETSTIGEGRYECLRSRLIILLGSPQPIQDRPQIRRHWHVPMHRLAGDRMDEAQLSRM